MGDPIVSKGPLDARAETPALRFERYAPDPPLDALVRHYWIAEWTFPPGGHLDQPLLVYPSCNIVVEPGNAALFGPDPELQVHRIEGSSWGFGVLLQVATGFRVAGFPIERIVSSSSGLGGEADESMVAPVREAMSTPSEHRSAIAVFEKWLTGRVGTLTDEDLLVNRVAHAVEDDHELVRVTDIAERFGLSTRRLERLVARYVGLPPKWLIQRRRLQEAAHTINTDPSIDLTALAIELGYADYPHFSRDFAATIGMTPRAFRGQRA